jgi:5'-3' exonuclease
MDCNSIIYDAIRSISELEDDFESKLIDIVIEKIHKYILEINPLNTIFIAFDGVAPLAKMNQQRTRRYKSDFMSKMEYIKSEKELKWSTSNITPGTKFMDMLSKKISYHFSNTETKYKVNNVIVSGSDEIGEGEHKIFKYIRDHPNIEENMMLYGLDSDLIMLSIFNNSCFRKGFIFREAPEFIKSSIVLDEKPNENEIKKMTEFINNNSPLCVHIPFKINEKTYYIEYTAKKKYGTRSEKIIISISLDREHKEEIIHITCFPHCFIH